MCKIIIIIEDPDTNSKNIQPGYRNRIWYWKVYHAENENWKKKKEEELQNQESIRTLEQKKSNWEYSKQTP